MYQANIPILFCRFVLVKCQLLNTYVSWKDAKMKLTSWYGRKLTLDWIYFKILFNVLTTKVNLMFSVAIYIPILQNRSAGNPNQMKVLETTVLFKHARIIYFLNVCSIRCFIFARSFSIR